MPETGNVGGVERSERRERHSLFDFRGEKAESGKLNPLAAPNGCFRHPPGIALGAVPYVGDDMGRVLRVQRRCHSIPANAGISFFGALALLLYGQLSRP